MTFDWSSLYLRRALLISSAPWLLPMILDWGTASALISTLTLSLTNTMSGALIPTFCSSCGGSGAGFGGGGGGSGGGNGDGSGFLYFSRAPSSKTHN